MVNPKILCSKHLGGEYVECLMLAGTFRRKRRIGGYVKNNCVEPLSLVARFKELKKECLRRGRNARKDIPEPINILVEYLPNNWKRATVNREDSLKDLLQRCPTCNSRYKELKEENV